MYTFYKFLHFLGLAIGAGTPFYMTAIAMNAAKSGNPQTIKSTMLGAGGAVSMVGAIGLVLLIISGVLMTTASILPVPSGWEFKAKMAVVLLIVVFVGYMKTLARKAKNEAGMATMGKIKKLSPIGLVLSLSAIILAVMAFH